MAFHAIGVNNGAFSDTACYLSRRSGKSVVGSATMAPNDADVQELIERASGGDSAARQHLLMRYRDRLRKMVAVRLDRRLAARVDPSDVVQEALLEAAQKLSGYLRERPLPFYPWLRRLAWEHLIKLHQRHVAARKRSTTREAQGILELPDESVLELVQRLVASGTSPSNHLLREELRQRVQAALAELAEGDREILVMRYLEQLAMSDIAAVLGISEGAVKMRHTRALRRLCGLLGSDPREEQS
jgi:RNA polymerase sigma-70 factor (ECF subfamily)